MNVIKCKNGHFFDAEAYGACPICGAAPITAGGAAPAQEEKKKGWGKKRKEKEKGKAAAYSGPISFDAIPIPGNEKAAAIPVPPQAGTPPVRQQGPVGSVYCWNPAAMSVQNIAGLLVRFEPTAGQPPIMKVTFDGTKLKVMNTINGSRDGGREFPKDYFAQREIPLSQEQIAQLKICLQSIHLESWKTPDAILRCLEAPTTGFCICNSVAVTFANGSRFECLEPRGKEFDQLVSQLRSLYEPWCNAAPTVPTQQVQSPAGTLPEIPDSDKTVVLPLFMETAPLNDQPVIFEEPVSQTEKTEAQPEVSAVEEPVSDPEEDKWWLAPEPSVVPVAEEPAAQPVAAVAEEPKIAPMSPLQEAVRNASASNEGKTLSYFNAATNQSAVQSSPRRAVDPVVGWLVCVGGRHFGECFSVYAGRNSIGRSNENRIVIADDNSISRNKHAFIVYEPKKRDFFLLPGESSGLIYVNEDCIFQPSKLNARDMIELGDSKFLFVPLCTETFSWEAYMAKGE